MLATITLLTSLIISIIYPLSFWISYRDPLKSKFHHFHTALPCVIAGILTVFIYFGEFPVPIKSKLIIYFVALLFVTAYYWKKESCHPFAMTVPSLFGMYVYYDFQKFLFSPDISIFLISILAGLILCASLFTMNLGHWYLNVHGLPIKHLMHATNVFWGLVALRALWNLFYFVWGRVFYDGEQILIYQFMVTLDGFLLLIAICFGTLLPLCTLYMVREVLKLKNTQAATGILYVILCAVLVGDLTYKYYLIKYGIVL